MKSDGRSSVPDVLDLVRTITRVEGVPDRGGESGRAADCKRKKVKKRDQLTSFVLDETSRLDTLTVNGNSSSCSVLDDASQERGEVGSTSRVIQIGPDLLCVPLGHLHLLVHLSAVGRRATFLGGDLFVGRRLVVIGGLDGSGSRKVVDESLGHEDLDVEDEGGWAVVTKLEKGGGDPSDVFWRRNNGITGSAGKKPVEGKRESRLELTDVLDAPNEGQARHR